MIFLGRLDAIDADKTAAYVATCLNFDGGFGSRPGAESHAGPIRPVCCRLEQEYLQET